MMKWTKPDEQERIFAQINNRCIGYVKPVTGSKDSAFTWEIVVIGATFSAEQKGQCQTRSGAKKALTRNWQRWCDYFNLISRSEVFDVPHRSVGVPIGSNIIPLRSVHPS